MILRAAHVDATWGPPPSADEIRALDQTRLLAQVGGTDEVAEEDLAAAKLLIAERTSEEIAIALARLNRARLPAPEDLMDSGPSGAPSARGPNAQGPGDRGGEGAGPRRAGFEDSLWFRIDMGRNRNADPRWLLPMICRRGHITKTEIGAIRIYERETRFEIARDAAPRFAAALRKAEDDGVRIEPLAEGESADPGQAARPQNRSRPPFKGGFKGKSGGDRDAAPGAKPPYRAKPKDKGAPRSKPYGKPPRGGGGA
jgi:ATP-dependent RNA helicase DeaD